MKYYTHPVTPAQPDTKYVRSIKSHLKIIESPIYIDCIPLESAPSCECFLTVEKHVKDHGGTMILGWAIWELPEVYIEAEFHAVWRKTDGSFLDISPKDEPTKRVLFLPDANARYEGAQVNNIRIPICNAPAVLALFAACNKEFELSNKGERKFQYGERKFSDEEMDVLHEILFVKKLAENDMLKLVPKISPNMPCICGSGLKSKKCCKT